MPSSKEYKSYILEQLGDLDDITYKSMMGEFLLYYRGILFGGIYDDRLLVKKVDTNKSFNMSESIPYSGAQPMYLVEDVDDKEKLESIVVYTFNGLVKREK